MKRFSILFLFVFALGINHYSNAQSGGKKREKYAKKGKKNGLHILTQYKSHGHADEFARGGSIGRKGRLAKFFYKPKPAWNYKSAGSARSHERENRGLFARFRSKGKTENAEYQNRQRAERSKRRVRGAESFQKKRNYKSR